MSQSYARQRFFNEFPDADPNLYPGSWTRKLALARGLDPRDLPGSWDRFVAENDGADGSGSGSWAARGASALGVPLVSGKSPGAVVALTWQDLSALVDLDLANDRVYYDGDVHTVDSFLAAYGGSRVGDVITIEPKVVGAELVSNPDISVDASGYAPVPAAPYNTAGIITISRDPASGGQLKVDRISSGDGNNQSRIGTPVAVVGGKAYLLTQRFVELTGAGAGSISLTAFSGVAGGKSINTATAVAGTLLSGYFPCSALMTANAPVWHRSNYNATPPYTRRYDDISVKEVVPLIGYNYQAVSGRIVGTTPAVASGNKVLCQFDTDDEFSRIRVVWGADKHLHVITTAHHGSSTSTGVEQANLDLGVVEVNTPFDVRWSVELNSVKASLDGGVIVSDTSAALPSAAYFRIGRSYTGETWDGTISRITVFPAAMSDADMTDPQKAFMVFGDSTANGDGTGVTTKWYDALRTAYTPDRSVYEVAQGGENTTQMLARVVADSDHRKWTTIFMDRPNTGETSAVWLANMKNAANLLRTDRWFVVPPVLNSPSGQPSDSDTAINEIQAALLSDPFFAGRTLNAVDQAAYVVAMNDDATRVTGDWIHFNDAGQALQASTIKAALDALGW